MIKVRYACQSPISLAAAWVEALRKVDWGAATWEPSGTLSPFLGFWFPLYEK